MHKTIVVVGASRGIGEQLVQLFAQDSNNTVVALSRNLARMQANFSGFENVHSFKFDLAENDVRRQATEVLRQFESIDYVVNNAGYLVNKSFEDISDDDFKRSYQINTIGVMQFVQAVLNYMKTGHIVNISSMGGFQGSVKFPGLTAYSTSKAAVCSFTELFAEEYKDSGIKMNCLCLGAAQTEMLEEAFPGYEAPLSALKMAEFIAKFTLEAHEWMHGKIIPVALSTP